MSTLIHSFQQSLSPGHAFVAALVMLGLGLEGLSAEQEMQPFRQNKPRRFDGAAQHRLCAFFKTPRRTP